MNRLCAVYLWNSVCILEAESQTQAPPTGRIWCDLTLSLSPPTASPPHPCDCIVSMFSLALLCPESTHDLLLPSTATLPALPRLPAEPSPSSPLLSLIIRAVLWQAPISASALSFSSSLREPIPPGFLNCQSGPGLLGSVSYLKQVFEEADVQNQEWGTSGQGP